MNSLYTRNPYAAALIAAVGLVGETIGMGSQSLRKTVAWGEESALALSMRTGAHRGYTERQPRKRSGGKLARMAAKGALGSSGRSSRSRVYVGAHYGVEDSVSCYLNMLRNHARLVNRAKESRS